MLKGVVFTVLAILTFLYGGLIRKVGSGTRFCRTWYYISAAFLLFGVLYIFGLDRYIPAFIFTVIRICLLVISVLVALLLAVILTGFGTRKAKDLDYIIVLGSQVKEDGPSRVLMYRLDAAADCLAEDPYVRCIVTGGQGYNEPFTEAEGMERYLIEKGIPAERIIKEDRATTTYENLLFSEAFLDKEKDAIGILTNNFHLRRSLCIARKLGYRNIRGIGAYSTPLFLPNNILREIMAFFLDILRGHII